MRAKQKTKREVRSRPKAEIEVPPDDYEPSRDELEEEVPMPNLTLEEAKERFMRPFKMVPTVPKKPTGTPD